MGLDDHDEYKENKNTNVGTIASYIEQIWTTAKKTVNVCGC